MAGERKALIQIVNAVHRVYTEVVQSDIDDAPEWTKASIQAHLLFSTEFSCLFDHMLERVLQNIIVRQNATMVDGVTGEVIEEKRKAFMHSVEVSVFPLRAGSNCSDTRCARSTTS